MCFAQDEKKSTIVLGIDPLVLGGMHSARGKIIPRVLERRILERPHRNKTYDPPVQYNDASVTGALLHQL